MTPRPKIPRETESKVLLRSRRRCALCFGMHRDAEVKRGQIAHLDHDSGNNEIDNLAFLCLEHHDLYDSRTSQSKGITITEAKVFRAELEEALLIALEAPITLKTVESTEWAGIYRWETPNESAELTIERSANNEYSIRGFSFWGTKRLAGPNIGEIEQAAVSINDQLVISIGDYSLSLRIAEGRLEAKERGGPGPFGLNVSFAGEYHRVPVDAQALPQPVMRSFESEFWPEEGVPVFHTRADSLRLRSRPDNGAPLEAVVPVEFNQPIEFSHFRYRTVRPGRVIVHEHTETSGRVLGSNDYVSRDNYYEHGGETVTIQLAPGDRFEFLQYRAEGSGFIRWEGIVLDLPMLPWHLPENTFELVTGPVTESWIRVCIGKSDGWVLVNESIVETGREF